MNMKVKLHNELNIVKYIMSTPKYKAFFLFTVLLCIYGALALGVTAGDFVGSILKPFQFYLFNVFLFAICFLNNNNACSIFKNDFSFYIMRLRNKKEYVNTELRVSSLLYSIHFIIAIMIMLACYFPTTFSNVDIHSYNTYTISNVIYCVFYLFRYFVIGLLIMLISTMIHISSNEKYVIVFEMIFLFFLYYFNVYITIQDKVILNVWKYFSPVNYSTFSLEVTSSIFMILILEIIFLLIYYLINKLKRMVIS